MAEKVIGGRTFKTTPLLAEAALELQGRILQVLGPAVGELGAAMRAGLIQATQSEATGEVKGDAMQAGFAALGKLISNLPPKEYVNLVKTVIQIAHIERPSGDWSQCDLNGDFTDHKKDILPVVWFVLEVQFGDFFGEQLGNGNLFQKLGLSPKRN